MQAVDEGVVSITVGKRGGGWRRLVIVQVGVPRCYAAWTTACPAAAAQTRRLLVGPSPPPYPPRPGGGLTAVKDG